MIPGYTAAKGCTAFDLQPRPKILTNRKTANMGLGRNISAGRAPESQSGGHWFKSHSSKFVFVQNPKFDYKSPELTQILLKSMFSSPDAPTFPKRRRMAPFTCNKQTTSWNRFTFCNNLSLYRIQTASSYRAISGVY